jgi:hypothetical protein
VSPASAAGGSDCARRTRTMVQDARFVNLIFPTGQFQMLASGIQLQVGDLRFFVRSACWAAGLGPWRWRGAAPAGCGGFKVSEMARARVRRSRGSDAVPVAKSAPFWEITR